MQRFLEICTQLGLDKINERAIKLKASIPALQSENVLFFICGSDFISDASDTKFKGLVEVFVKPGSKFELNLYPGCLAKFNAMLSDPAIKASMEGSSVADQPGAGVRFNPANMQKAAGVRGGGAANFNLQTKALEVVVTDKEGLDKDGALDAEVIPKLKTAFAKPAAALNAVGMATLADMRDSLTPYWGADLKKLGL